ncbi:hypothetical protein [Streptomyces sp. NPDC002088]|uniref:hypothetical protein n=1 Tax=Streptomyces sp. NPDC002088 TaxID=3154665 RepID=UPI00332BB3B5
MSQLWQPRFQGQESPSATGWKVQIPPSVEVLRRARSMARAWACSRMSGGCFLGEKFAGLGGARARDPHVFEDVLQVFAGEMDVVLGHPVGDLAQIPANVRQAGAGPQHG